MSGLQLLGLLVGVLLVCRLVETGAIRGLPVVALGVGLLAVATPPGQELRALLGEGLLVVVRLLAWALAPLIVLGLLAVGMVHLARGCPPAGSPGRVASVVLILVLGLVGGLLIVQFPGASVVGRGVGGAMVTAAGQLAEEVALVLAGDGNDGGAR